MHTSIYCAALALALTGGSNLAAAAELPPLAPIASLDTARYAGTWHEMAKYPNFFQRKCVAHTKATYSANPDGTIRVDNRCGSADGKVEEAVGLARQPAGPGSPKLEVRFAPSWLSFLPFVWADYWVIDLDPAYSLAAVSEPKREYLWILSRTPTVDAQAYATLLLRLSGKGFDIVKLVPTPQAP